MKKPIITSDAPLLRQQDALETYFNALLSEIDEPDTDQQERHELCSDSSGSTTYDQAELINEAPFDTSLEHPVNEITELATDDFLLDANETVDFIDTGTNINEPESLIETLEESELNKVSNVDVIPEWARSLFQVISFSLGESLCMASINRVAGIIPTPTSLTFLPGQAPWFMGMHQYKGSTVNVIDMALIIGQSGIKVDARSGGNLPKGFIVLIGNGRWGFIIRSMGNMIMLENSEVKWKSHREHSDIVVGTAVKDMSTLLDLDVVLKFLS